MTTSSRSPRTRICTTLVLGALGCVLGAAPAAAQSSSPAPVLESDAGIPTGALPPGPSVQPSPSAAALTGSAALGARYESLSSALVGYYAQQSGQSLQSYLTINGPALAQAYSAPELGTLRASSAQELAKSLQQGGLGVGDAGFGQLDQLAQQLQRRSSSPDARVIAAGASYTKALAQLRIPELTAPRASSSVDSFATQVPRAGLAFGLVLDKSLAKTVTSSPDLFSQIQREGLGSPAAMSVWNRSLAEATKEASADYTSALIAPCEAEMFAVMGTGDPNAGQTLLKQKKPSNCGSCVAGGMYLHQQLSTILNPGATSLLGGSGAGGELKLQTLGNLPAYQRDAFAQANPDLMSQLNTELRPNKDISGCGAVSAGTQNALAATLPSFLGSLSK